MGAKKGFSDPYEQPVRDSSFRVSAHLSPRGCHGSLARRLVDPLGDRGLLHARCSGLDAAGAPKLINVCGVFWKHWADTTHLMTDLCQTPHSVGAVSFVWPLLRDLDDFRMSPE